MSPTVPTSKKKTKVSTATSTRRERRRQVQKSDSQRTTEGEPTEQNGAAVSWGTRIRARLGPSGARSVLMAVRAGLMFVSASAGYVVAMFAAVTVVPNVFLMVAAGTGIGPASPLEMQLAHWLTPSLFLIGLIFVLVLMVVRWLWRVQRRLAAKARHSLLGQKADR